MIETYIVREKVDSMFLDGLQRRKHIIVYGASKQGKTSLTNRHLDKDSYVKVNCSTGTTVIDIYKSILRQLDVEILESEEENIISDSDIKIGFKAKLKVPIIGEIESSANTGVGKKENLRPILRPLNII